MLQPDVIRCSVTRFVVNLNNLTTVEMNLALRNTASK